MSGDYLLGIDIGTSGSEGVVIDRELNVLASAAVEHETLVPNPGWAEHDAEEAWWGDFVTISRRLLEQVDIGPDEIAGVGVSALFAAMLPVDEEGNPLRPGILYGVDTRTTEEIEILNDRIGEERIYEVSGNPLTPQSVGPKILWFKRNEPEKFDRTHKVLDTVGYIVHQLTGEYTIDNAIAAFFHPLYDLSATDWAEEIFEETGIPRELLPESEWSTEIAGGVTEGAAAETGLAEDTTVIVGTGDALASMVSVNAVEPGESIFMYGTTGVVFTALERPRPTKQLWAFPFCLEGKYTIAGGMATAGAVVRWFRDEFGYEERWREGTDAYEALDKRAAGVPPGSEGLVTLPYFSGERTPMADDSARGTMVGLTLSHTKAHVYRSILEGVGYGLRHHVEAMEQTGVPIERALAIGGGARSSLWRRIVSDITGMSQEYVSTPIGSPLGGAYLAGLGTGVFEDLSRIEDFATVRTRTDPDPEAEAIYDEYYAVYRDVYPQLKGSMHELARLGRS
jgi:xylulokinase